MVKASGGAEIAGAGFQITKPGHFPSAQLFAQVEHFQSPPFKHLHPLPITNIYTRLKGLDLLGIEPNKGVDRSELM